MTRYAFVNNNVIEKIEDTSEDLIIPQTSKYQIIADLTSHANNPQVGWRFVGNKFEPSEQTLNDSIERIKVLVLKPAKQFALEIEENFVAENIAMGITQAGKTDLVTERLSEVLKHVRNASLYSALAAIQNVVVDESVHPFITAPRMLAFANKIKKFLNIP